MVKWGNKRANRYWEAKLAEGHVPNESKIESFVRTKYESRRWVMDGPMPDPETLEGDDGDDDVPLKVVQERARGNSMRNGQAGQRGGLPPPSQQRARPQEVDLFGDDVSAPVRPSTTEPAVRRQPPPVKAPAAPPKQTRPGESLLGLDFLGGGGSSAGPQRPSSTGASGPPARTDLKQSILSLYASKPAAAPQPPQQQPQRQASSASADLFSGMSSPGMTSPASQPSMGGLGDAFSSLSFGSSQSQPSKPGSFSGLMSPTGPQSRQNPQVKSPNPLSGGSFFDAKPAPPPKPVASTPAARKPSYSADFGDFSSAASPAPAQSSSSFNDLFDTGFASAPAPPPKQTPPISNISAAKSPPPVNASAYTQSAFNLSCPTAKPVPPSGLSNNAFSSISNVDAWGSNDAWATPDPAPASAPAPAARPAPPVAQTSWSKPTPAPAPAKVETPFDSGWGDMDATPAKPAASSAASRGGFSVQQDEEFGGWSHASPVAATAGPKQGGLAGNQDDLFGNVWE